MTFLNSNKLHGGGTNNNNLMVLASTLNLEYIVAKFNMDIFKLQEDGKVAKDRMKVTEVRENMMEEREKYGELFLFWSEMCKWWLEKFSNEELSRDSSKKKMGDSVWSRRYIISSNKQLWPNLRCWEKKHCSQVIKLLIEAL
jgi:hypothetical protein